MILRKPPLLARLLLAALAPVCRGERETVDERFGVMTHFAQGWNSAMIPLIARSGVAGVRDEIYWREIESQPGRFSFPDRYETAMGSLSKQHLAPFVVLSFENELYDGGATPNTDDGRAAYARYGVEVLRHYGSQIKAVEIWNEYNGGFVHGPAEGDRAGSYLRMLRATATELKRARPDVTIVGGATAGVPLPYWEKLLAGGALEYVDALSVHPYRFDSPPEGIEEDIAELASLVTRYNGGRPKPIWVSEIGWKTRPSSGAGDIDIDDAVQAQFLVRAYALLFSAGVQRVYWYLFRDYQEFNMGLVRDDGVTLKPAYTAMATMVRQLRNARFVAREATPADLYSIVFRRDSGEDVRVVWSLQPRTVALTGVTGITDLLGRTVAFHGSVPLGESPIFVRGPVKGLPGAVDSVVADARRGFSETQGREGWSYGYRVGDADGFIPLPTCGCDDWHAAWQGGPPYLAITSTNQHPASQDGAPVAAIRRWQSGRTGNVRVKGSFRAGKSGDGVGVSIAVNDGRRFRKLLGGDGNAVAESFDFVEAVQPGTTIDFIVDPGPAANVDHDGTNVVVTIWTSP